MRISDWSSDVCSSDLSLAYDDALDSQLDNAIPALDRHGFHASFYLPLAAATLRTRLDEWRAAAARGHELGNHTLFHQCSGSAEARAGGEIGRAPVRTSVTKQQRVCPFLLESKNLTSKHRYTH